MNNPWEEVPHIWRTKAAYFSWLRGAIRRMWSDYPLRKEWKKKALRPVTADEKRRKVFHPSTKNVGMCSFCHEWFPGSKLEVDHIVASEGCTSKETAEKFLWHCAGLTGEFFQLACKPCHKIKSHAENRGMTFEEASADKRAILFEKLPTEKQKNFLLNHNVKPVPSNVKARREAYKQLILNGTIK